MATYMETCLFGGDPITALDSNSLSGDLPDPVGAFLRKNELRRFCKSAEVQDVGWDGPLTETAALPASFEKHSGERFEKVCTAIRRAIADSEACESAIEIDRQAFA